MLLLKVANQAYRGLTIQETVMDGEYYQDQYHEVGNSFLRTPLNASEIQIYSLDFYSFRMYKKVTKFS